MPLMIGAMLIMQPSAKVRSSEGITGLSLAAIIFFPLLLLILNMARINRKDIRKLSRNKQNSK